MLIYMLVFFTLFAQVHADVLPYQEIMTPDEAHEMGLDSSTPEQKQAFERWIASWTHHVIEEAPSYRQGVPLMQWVQTWPPTKEEVVERQKIDKIKDSGAILELKDGSVFAISPLFSYVVAQWQKGQDVEI